jgi:hypothetical protein
MSSLELVLCVFASLPKVYSSITQRTHPSWLFRNFHHCFVLILEYKIEIWAYILIKIRSYRIYANFSAPLQSMALT